MMKQYKWVILVLIYGISFASKANVVDETMTAFMAANDISGAAVVMYVDGKPTAYYYGHTNKSKKVPVTKNTIFELGSMTNLMTNLLLAIRLDDAVIQIDDSVTQSLPSLSSAYEDISLMNLATQTSGLPISGSSDYVLKSPPISYPDEQWVYSKLGNELLDASVESMFHQKLDVLYLKKILSPLNMAPLALTVPAGYQHFLSVGYNKQGIAVNAGNSFKSSSASMQHFLAAAIGLPGTPDSILYPMRMTQSEYVKLIDRKIGLGWEIHSLRPDKISTLLNDPEDKFLGPVKVVEIYDKPRFNGDTLIDTIGNADGFTCYMAVIPNKKAGILVLSNKALSNAAIVNMSRSVLFKSVLIMPKVEVTA